MKMALMRRLMSAKSICSSGLPRVATAIVSSAFFVEGTKIHRMFRKRQGSHRNESAARTLGRYRLGKTSSASPDAATTKKLKKLLSGAERFQAGVLPGVTLGLSDEASDKGR